MTLKNDKCGLAAQMAKAYRGNPPAHIIVCQSPLSAYMTRSVFREIIAGQFPHYDNGHTQRGDLKLPVLVRCFLHTAWQSANADFCKQLEESVKAQAKLLAEHFPLEGAKAVASEVSDRVWETVEALLNDPDLHGLESSVGEEVNARALIWPEQPARSAFDAWIGSEPGDLTRYLPQLPQLRDTLDIRGLFNAGSYGPRHGQADGYDSSHRLSPFCFLVGVYQKRGTYWQRQRESQGSSPESEQTICAIGGCFLPHSTFCWVGDAPEKLNLDDQQRPHNANGPAIEYLDGWRIYATEGSRVPSFKFEAENDWLDILGERNPQVQRTMMEKHGPRRFLEELKASIVHTDDYGKLWKTEKQIEVISDHRLESGHAGFGYVGVGNVYRFEGFAFVEVVNSTANADGTFKDHFLRVPFEVQSAREAVAWTFGKKPSEYEPGVET